MSYRKAMKHSRNPQKYKRAQPMLFDAPSFKGAKSIWANEKECPCCGFIRPVVFFENGACDLCQK